MTELLLGLLGLAGLGAAFVRLRGSRSRVTGPADPASFTPKAEGGLRALFVANGLRFDVSPDLLEAIAIVESNLDPNAVNPADPSYGLGQVLCVSDGADGACQNRLPAISEFRSMTPRKLLEPETNVRIYAQIVRANFDRYPGDADRAIVAYNNFTSAEEGRGGNGLFRRTSTRGLDPNEYVRRIRSALAGVNRERGPAVSA